MPLSLPRPLLRLSLLLLPCLPVAAHADQWTPPTPEELGMTSQPQVPGASAVYLYREEITEDNLHMFSVYVRLKILNDGGKRYGDVELQYNAARAIGLSVGDIAGRTIHPDGTVIPFTGKPYEKLIEKTRDHKYMAKVFSMPDVQVGSIIEYRYKVRYDDFYFVPPQWYVQSELFTRRAHYLWNPTDKNLLNERGQPIGAISWTHVLPSNATIVQSRKPHGGIGHDDQLTFELALHDIPATPNDDYMPPISSFSYRVLFYYSPYRNAEEFWRSEGKFWAKAQDKFIGPGPAVKDAVRQLTTPTDTDEQKLHKLYAAVQNLENTRFTRNHAQSEDKAQGLGDIKTTDDIWLRKRGTDDQLAELFVAMARAAGMKAYAMSVSDRSRRIFFTAFLSLDQLDDEIAVVNVGGKDVFFDPGTRFCPYGQLFWKHTMTGGLRQVDGGGAFDVTPADLYTNSRLQRVANLTLDRDGLATGTVHMTYIGAPAIEWRQRAILGDDESLRHELQQSLEELLPHSLEITVASIDKLNDFDQPLSVTFNVKGNPGSATGKRLLLPADLFEANATPTFPHEKREVGVYLQYGRIVQDAVRINFPPTFTVESAPASAKLQFGTFAAYSISEQGAPTSITTRRDYVLGNIIYLPTEYSDLRHFYSGMEAKDQESYVLRVAAPAPVVKASAGAN